MTTTKKFIATDSSGKKLLITCLLKKNMQNGMKHLPELTTIDSLGSVSHVNAHNDGMFVICGEVETEYSCPELVAFIQQWNESA